jgi:hypothetical protein
MPLDPYNYSKQYDMIFQIADTNVQKDIQKRHL